MEKMVEAIWERRKARIKGSSLVRVKWSLRSMMERVVQAATIRVVMA